MATLSSKVTPSGVASAAQGGLADTAIQPNSSPTFGNVTATSYAGDGSNLTGLPAGYTDADVDTHLNYSTATAGQVLSYSGSDYDWVDTGRVVSVHKAFSNTNQTIASTSLTNVTGLSITMTPKSANNLIVLQSVVSTNCVHVNSMTFLKDGAKTTTTSGTNSNETDTHSTTYNGGQPTLLLLHPLLHYETAGNTTSRTYTVAATAGWAGGIHNQKINNRSGDDMASTSWFLLWEFAQ